MFFEQPISIDTIANFFDDLKEDWLEAFDFNPNSQLPNGKVIRIKDIFIVSHRGKDCVYNVGEEELCWKHFMTIVANKRIMIEQAMHLEEKIRRISNPDNYISVSKNDTTYTNNSTSNQNNSTTQDSNSDGDSKLGGFKGSADATQFSTFLSEDCRLIEAKKVMEKSEDNIMNYLTPFARQIDHTITLEKYLNHSNNITKGTLENVNSSTGKRMFTNQRWVEAMNEVSALSQRIRSLRSEFVEAFWPLFRH